MLEQSQILRQTAPASVGMGFGHARSHESSLTLTSLVDCFTTILVYLLLASSFGTAELQIPNRMALPHAYHSANLEDGIVVVVNNHGQYTIEYGHTKSTVPVNQLFEALHQEKSATSQNFVVVQADKSTNFSEVNPAVLTALQAGFKQVRFAVLQEDAR